ncbi:MAG: polysaccharide deacetylase family protein [Magnetococcales bacterium]|nr:polysaccharide deacetylase family protein [Magnetococcales bacterium]
MTNRCIMTRYADFVNHYPWRGRLRNRLRDSAVFLLSLRAASPVGRRAVRILCYHHLFDDERAGFDRQLRYMKNLGEFLSLEDGVALLRSGNPIDGHYFCFTFDDGYRNCLSNAVPILHEHGATAAFCVVSELAGLAPGADPDPALLARILGFSLDPNRWRVEFLSWEECRQLRHAGMTIVAHSLTHRRLASLTPDQASAEMRGSMEEVRSRTGEQSLHFAAPFGRPERDFLPDRDPGLAREVGLRSFLTLESGPNCRGADPFRLKRNHLLPWWGDFQMKYFFAPACPE